MGQNELDVVVKGDLILQHGIARNAAVGVKDGVITALYSSTETPSAKETIDARGSLVFPGVVDSHVHSYSILGVEGFEHSTPAAAAGGILPSLKCLMMPAPLPPPPKHSKKKYSE